MRVTFEDHARVILEYRTRIIFDCCWMPTVAIFQLYESHLKVIQESHFKFIRESHLKVIRESHSKIIWESHWKASNVTLIWPSNVTLIWPSNVTFIWPSNVILAWPSNVALTGPSNVTLTWPSNVTHMTFKCDPHWKGNNSFNKLICLDPTPELQLRQSLVASAKMKVDRISSDGKRLVGQKEWNLLQQQVS
jgi:hypothetical protein